MAIWTDICCAGATDAQREGRLVVRGQLVYMRAANSAKGTEAAPCVETDSIE